LDPRSFEKPLDGDNKKMKSYLKGHHFNIGATGGRQIINSSVSQDVAASAVQGSNQEKYSD
jgi:hypothetical protein